VTPEGKIKKKVNALLLEFPDVWSFMPVQTGRGAAGLDYHCIIKHKGNAFAFFIETKAPDAWLTERQELLIKKLNRLNAPVFIINDDKDVENLRRWLQNMLRYNSSLRVS
jgi:hypothetical protein